LALDSLFKVPPRQEENAIIHKVFVTTLDHDVRSFSARVKPENSEWMTDSKLKSVMMCEPKHRNDYNKVFGGLIMEKCMDLALTLTYNYTGCGPTPVCTHVDDVEFIKPVEIGDLMFFHSQVVFTHKNMVQTRVSAEVKDKVDKKLKLTNVLQITWELPDQAHVPAVVPSSFHESMAYLTGRRHFLIGLENQGLLAKGMAEIQINKASNYLPSWFHSEGPQEEELEVHTYAGNFNDYFLKAEETKRLREREAGVL